jgi:hypothetical protein
MSNYEQPTFPPQGWRPGDGTPAKPFYEKQQLCDDCGKGEACMCGEPPLTT